MKQSTLYWICQVAGWLSYSLFFIIMTLVFAGPSQIGPTMLQVQAVLLFSLILSSHLMRLYMKRQQWTKLRVAALIPRVLAGTLVTSILAQGFVHIVIYGIPIQGLTPFSWVNFGAYVASVYLVLMLWAAIYFAYHSIRSSRRNEIEKLELRAALNEAELAILKNQINPHFLFNALNNIRSLILTNPDRARKMVTHISELLRYSIQFNASEKVSLRQEIEIVKDYLQLESIQFNKRLSYEFQIDEDSLEVKIPPMAIQLLVENAIKHGISKMESGGNISITSSLKDSHLLIAVQNDGQLKQTTKREGVGLKNLIERLQILFGQFAELSVENSENKTVTASLKIPIA